jgi:DNA-3-methyladenine glycosylase
LRRPTIGEAYGRDFFERPPDVVASDLVGTMMVLHDDDRSSESMIVETEAYGGFEDPASHAYRGPTKRNEVMFGPAGFLYVYRSYGIHWCMNVVTSVQGQPNAVLLRAAELFESIPDGDTEEVVSIALRGPGNLTRGLSITGADNGIDCCGTRGRHITFHPLVVVKPSHHVAASPRIGISVEVDRPWRFFLEGHPAVSKFRSPPKQK